MRETVDGYRLFAEPVREIEGLRSVTKRIEQTDVGNDSVKLDFEAELMDLDLQFKAGESNLVIDVRGVKLEYVAAERLLRCVDLAVPIKLQDGTLRLRILVDRGSIEVFVNQGEVAISKGVHLDETNRSVQLQASPGWTLTTATLHSLASARQVEK